MPEFFAQRIVAEEHGIVYGFLQWLNLLRIKVGVQIVAKRPHHSHIGVGVLQPKEILTANPSVFVVVLAVEGIDEERGHIQLISLICICSYLPISRAAWLTAHPPQNKSMKWVRLGRRRTMRSANLFLLPL